jgi:hypothetical protein
MNSVVTLTLRPSADQHARLVALQVAFAEVCNVLAPKVQQTRTWNRVALHHLAYRELREQFPSMGSQMVCNAIYSVSRACRMVFQTAGSPFHITRLAGKPLPLLQFTANSPVYFDRHTLSLKDGVASMYTLDGRIKFQLELRPEDERAFHERKLREIVMLRQGEAFNLQFMFGEAVEPPAVQTITAESPLLPETASAPANGTPGSTPHPTSGDSADPSNPVLGTLSALPEYLRVEEPT